MNNTLVKITEEDIKSKIYIIRGKEVMLDSDLAKLYECKNGTKSINLAVKRNINKFPDNFYFQLTDEEIKKLWFQNETANKMSRSNPYVFTEHGVAMLASVINTPIADDISVKIINAFVSMRHILLNSIDYQKELFIIQNKILEHDNKLLEHDSMFKRIFKE